MNFVDELPQSRGRGRPRLVSDDAIAELKQRVGQWAEVKEYGSPQLASRSGTVLRNHKYYRDLEFAVRGKVLYVRYPNGESQ